VRELADHILDLARNSIEAGASVILVLVQEDVQHDRLRIVVADNGRGMDAETRKRVLDPFYTTRTTRRWGLGVPLLAAACERSGGRLLIRSKPGSGTCIQAEVQLSHLDRAPLGNMGSVIQSLACEADRIVLRYRHRTAGGVFDLDTQDLQSEFEDVPLSEPTVLSWLGGYVCEELRTIGSMA
jgi:hypothetical protein